MKISDWKKIVYFTPEENWGDLDKVEFDLVKGLDVLRAYTGKPINVHCAWQERESGQHPLGRAADIQIVGLSLLDQFMAAQRFPWFRGIGVYPWWARPGLHIDIRPKTEFQPRSVWGSIGPKRPDNSNYVRLDKRFFRDFLTGP